jgi:hypothetical protein
MCGGVDRSGDVDVFELQNVQGDFGHVEPNSVTISDEWRCIDVDDVQDVLSAVDFEISKDD